MEFESQSAAILDELVLKLVKESALSLTYAQAQTILLEETSVEEIDAFAVLMAQEGVSINITALAIKNYFNIKWNKIITAITASMQQ